MRIIKDGNIEKTNVRFECGVCGCEFDADASDYSISAENRFEGTKWRKYNVLSCECPNCTHYLTKYIEEKNMPV